MSHDQLFVDASGDEGRERWPRAGRPEGVEPAVGQVGDARGEPEAEQMRQGEGVIADAAAVGVMGGNAQICLSRTGTDAQTPAPALGDNLVNCPMQTLPQSP